MFIVKIDGKAAAVTNTFDSAASYADGIRAAGRRVTIALALPRDVDLAIGSLQDEEWRSVRQKVGGAAGLWDA